MKYVLFVVTFVWMLLMGKPANAQQWITDQLNGVQWNQSTPCKITGVAILENHSGGLTYVFITATNNGGVYYTFNPNDGLQLAAANQFISAVFAAKKDQKDVKFRKHADQSNMHASAIYIVN